MYTFNKMVTRKQIFQQKKLNDLLFRKCDHFVYIMHERVKGLRDLSRFDTSTEGVFRTMARLEALWKRLM